jgi:type III pantothenate kinase
MLLALDTGNSNISVGVHDGSAWAHRWRLCTTPHRTADEYVALLRELLRGEDIRSGALSGSVLSSVVPELTGELETCITVLCGSPPLVVTPTTDAGIGVDTARPTEIGTDLLANAVGAWAAFGSACIAVGCGTAITLTAVSETARILGVSIAPGLNGAVEALSHGTAMLPHIELKPPARAIAADTVSAIQAGVLYGYASLVDGLVARMKKEMGGSPKVVGTGGHVGILEPLVASFDRVDPWLTLEGLRIIAERASPPPG